VEHRVVGGIDAVAAEHVAGDEETSLASAEKLGLVGGGVAPEDGIAIDIVGVVHAATNVVGGNKYLVKVGLHTHDGGHVVVLLEHAIAVALVEEVIYGVLKSIVPKPKDKSES
jgi:hypothetical protein